MYRMFRESSSSTEKEYRESIERAVAQSLIKSIQRKYIATVTALEGKTPWLVP